MLTDPDAIDCANNLKLSRRDAKHFGVAITKLKVFRQVSTWGYKYMEVIVSGRVVWHGNAWTTSDAKSKYIDHLLRLAGHGIYTD